MVCFRVHGHIKNAVVSSFVSHCGLLYTLLSQISCSTQHGILCEIWITAVTVQYVCTIIIERIVTHQCTGNGEGKHIVH